MELEQFTVTEEQQALRDSVRRFLEQRSPEAEVRRVMATDEGYDAVLWRDLAALGVCGLAIPEEYGGSGAGWQETAVVVEELGRALLPSPFFPSAVLSVAALLAGDDGARKEWLPSIADGSTIATLAVAEESGSWDLDAVALAARRDGDAWRLDGVKSLVPFGRAAQLLLVAARAGDGLGLFAVAGDADGLSLSAQRPLDPTSRFARLELSGVTARRVGDEAAVRRALDVGAVLLGAEQVGGARRTLEIASGYARTRTQFGRPIGGFQAVKHKCADMLLRTESAASLAAYGAWVADRPGEDLSTVAPTVKSFCSEASLFCAATNIQVHGGIGFTWEHPAHLYFKRAKTSELLFGSPSQHLLRLADALGV